MKNLARDPERRERMAIAVQSYTRIAAERYLYESGGGAFRRELTVDDRCLVVNYPGLWEATPSPRH